MPTMCLWTLRRSWIVTRSVIIQDKRSSRTALPLVSLKCGWRSRVILGDMQKAIRAATEEDKNYKKNTDVSSVPGRSSRVRTRFQILTSPIDRSNSPTLVCESFHTIRVYHYP